PNIRRLRVADDGSGGGSNPVYRLVVLEDLTNFAPGSPPPGDFSGGAGISPATLNAGVTSVQPEEYVEIKGGGQVHRIRTVLNLGSQAIPGTTLLEGNALLLYTPFPGPIPLTKEYRIIRRPRVLPGESALQLPVDVAIDAGKSVLPIRNA